MRVVFFFILLLSSSSLFAQEGIVSPPLVDTSIFEKVEVEASVDKAAWVTHLQKQLQPIIDKAAKRMKPGTYIVLVRFLVEKDGSISDVVAINNPDKALTKGAVQVVKTGPKWRPGELNGKKVRSYHTQPITFVFTEE